jgi:hypothetical protein
MNLELRGSWAILQKLGMCEGDCDSDNDCSGNLTCFQRFDGYTPVPGCNGLGVYVMDYCTDVSLSPTLSPPSYSNTNNPTYPPTLVTTYNYNNDSQDYGNNSTFFVMLAIVSFFTMICCCHISIHCCQHFIGQQREQEQQQGQGQGGTQAKKKHNRRLKILLNIIHKTVLPKEQAKEDQEGETDITVTPMLPHEKTLSSRVLLFECSSGDEEDEVYGLGIVGDIDSFRLSSVVTVPCFNQTRDESTHKSKINGGMSKDDLFVESMRSLRGAMNIKTDRSTSSLYSPKSCPICIEEYKVGDQIGWSRNTECHHAFHLDCILDWLMDNDDCPMCRRDYLCDGCQV